MFILYIVQLSLEEVEKNQKNNRKGEQHSFVFICKNKTTIANFFPNFNGS